MQLIMPTFYYKNFEHTWKLAVSQKSDQCQFFPTTPVTITKRKGYGDRSNNINKNHQRENTLIFLIPQSLYS